MLTFLGQDVPPEVRGFFKSLEEEQPQIPCVLVFSVQFKQLLSLVGYSVKGQCASEAEQQYCIGKDQFTSLKGRHSEVILYLFCCIISNVHHYILCINKVI